MEKTELNILVLGESGVGKSTFINAFANFLAFDSLDDAHRASELHCLIPGQFVMTDQSYNEVTVITGKDSNEDFTVGCSATQACKIYSFKVGDTRIRLIDTPGIGEVKGSGDIKGPEMDRLNFQGVLATVSKQRQIHGILILLKPNDSRLTVVFRYCINDLLAFLHKDASRNIVFCFTHTSGTHYKPGDTMPALKVLLKQHGDPVPTNRDTVYCFDSESYRYLAALKSGINFTEDEQRDYLRSWDQSRTETRRLLDHIKGLSPHQVHSTVSLNHARHLIQVLSRPLAEVNRLIQVNKGIIQDNLAEVTRSNATIQDLRSKLNCPIQQLKITKLEYPMTVCTNTSCTDVVGPPGKKRVHHKTICHDHCYLEGIEHDLRGDPGLMHCYAMKGNNCWIGSCRHSYREHMHIYYTSEEETVQTIDSAVQRLLTEKNTAQELKTKIIAARQQEIKSLDGEQKMIEKAAAKFAYFLKENAITAYNDAVLDYIDYLIKVEEEKAAKGGQRTVAESLRLSRNAYQKEKELLERAVQTGEAANFSRPDEIEAVVHQLYGLKFTGNSLREAMMVLNEARTKATAASEISPKSNRLAGSWATWR